MFSGFLVDALIPGDDSMCTDNDFKSIQICFCVGWPQSCVFYPIIFPRVSQPVSRLFFSVVLKLFVVPFVSLSRLLSLSLCTTNERLIQINTRFGLREILCCLFFSADYFSYMTKVLISFSQKLICELISANDFLDIRQSEYL